MQFRIPKDTGQTSIQMQHLLSGLMVSLAHGQLEWLRSNIYRQQMPFVQSHFKLLGQSFRV